MPWLTFGTNWILLCLCGLKFQFLPPGPLSKSKNQLVHFFTLHSGRKTEKRLVTRLVTKLFQIETVRSSGNHTLISLLLLISCLWAKFKKASLVCLFKRTHTFMSDILRVKMPGDLIARILSISSKKCHVEFSHQFLQNTIYEHNSPKKNVPTYE